MVQAIGLVPQLREPIGMRQRAARDDAHLTLVRRDREVIAKAIREHRATKPAATVTPTLRWWFAITLAIAACGGGGGSKKGDTYARATDAQQQCCENLSDAARDRCLGDVVRVEDRGVAKTEVNQATYACVVQHFVCDPASGRPTQPSAQAQLECIQDLPDVRTE